MSTHISTLLTSLSENVNVLVWKSQYLNCFICECILPYFLLTLSFTYINRLEYVHYICVSKWENRFQWHSPSNKKILGTVMHTRIMGIQSKVSSKQNSSIQCSHMKHMRLLSTVQIKNRGFIHIHIDTHIHTNIQSKYITIIEEGVMNLRKNGLGRRRTERGKKEN